MPYNNTAIPPSEEITGQASLPLARVKRIINTDEDLGVVSNNAVFVITKATEMFIQYLMKQGHNVAKSERKPRKQIQYKDLANAVSRIDNLDFLADTIPKTIPYKVYKEKKSKEAANGDSKDSQQTKLPGLEGVSNGTNGEARTSHAGPAHVERLEDAMPHMEQAVPLPHRQIAYHNGELHAVDRKDDKTEDMMEE